MSSFVITLVLLLTVNLIVSTLVQAMVPNYYLASMITSVIIAFLYGILATDEDRLHFFKQRNFYVRFLGSAIIFLLVDCVMFLL